jgi:[ribosomal protein S5]-alanine N-acetyltransferase
MDHLPVTAHISLSEIRSSDKPALVEQLNDKEIYERTLRIPYPYTDTNAEEWLAIVAKATQQQGRPVHWAIRNAEEHLIGACGFSDFEMGKSHRAEIGYWLSKPFWGQGIMTAVVRRACQYAFEEFGLVKIIAHVNAKNPASARVLEKCGFEQEGYLKKHHRKDGRLIDARLYALFDR